MSSKRPSLWVFAGPNGAGKSTLVERYKVGERIAMVNPDDIATTLRDGQKNELTVVAQAGRLAVSTRNDLLRAGKSFGIETTLTGRRELQLMQSAKDQGYKVNLVFVGIADADQSNSRVSSRVRAGGHDVPEVDIYRRFERSMANLPAAIALSDRVRVLDNTDERRRMLLKIDFGKVRAVSRTLPEWAKTAIPREMRTLTKAQGKGVSL